MQRRDESGGHETHMIDQASQRERTGWRIAYWSLSAIFLATAALTMAHVRGGFFTSYAADLFLPPWLYIVTRRLSMPGQSSNPLLRWLGSSPELAALSIFIGSALSEVSQIFWPKGFFSGIFDPLDLVAYGVGLLTCYIVDKRQQRPSSPVSLPKPTAST